MIRSRAFHLRATAAVAAAASLAAAACDSIVGAGNRKLDPTIVCDDDGCTCVAGRADCDGDPENACETDLDTEDNCGQCGFTCANGTCQSGACVCNAGFGECDGDPATVCETDLATSSDHCGSCERSCLGGPCESSLCVPQPVGTIGVYYFLMGDGVIYLAPYSDPGVFELDVDTGIATQIGEDTAQTDYAYAMAFDEDTIFWTGVEDVRATPLATGETIKLVTPTTTWQGMAVGGGKVYWGEIDGDPMGDPGTMRLMRTTTAAGGTPEQVVELGDANSYHDFVATADHVLWTQSLTIRRSAHDMVESANFLDAPSPPIYLTVGAGSLLFSGYSSGTYRAPLAGGSVAKLTEQLGSGPVAEDSKNVYFASYVDGDPAAYVWRVPRSGGPAVKIAEDIDMLFARIEVDAKWVYWIGGPNQPIVRVPK